MIENSELFNEIKAEIYNAYAKHDIIMVSAYMVMIYEYWKKDWITNQEKERLFNLTYHSVKLLLGRKGVKRK